MNPIKPLPFLAALCCLAGLALPAAAAETTAGDCYCFTSQDFSSENDLSGICITSLPASSAGTLLLGQRVILSGDILTANQIDQLTFLCPDGEEDQLLQMTYLPIYSDRVADAVSMEIQVLGRTDQAPIAEDSAMETYKNLPNEAMLKVKDPEGQSLTYTITRQPKRGQAEIREDGSFIYTPKKNKVGVDSFTYTATDPAGNVSREATVTITILKPESADQYTDTQEKSCRFAAEWMKNTGIFVSESLNGNGCFQPEKVVTRGEFLTMLTGALDIPVDEAATYTGFTDEAPDWLKPYLAAAMRAGLTAGWPDGDVFSSDSPITGAEAAVMLQNALDLTLAEETALLSDEESLPVWAADAITVLSSQGIYLSGDSNLTRGEAAVVLYQASCLKDTAPGLAALR